MNRFFKRCIFLALLGMALPALAVTEKEMEQAKAITAQAYLRYANDGSGYLDDFRATSLAELEGKLKAKERENIKAFKSVKVPTDYAGWDKAKLVEFWSVTFFTSPNLSDKGKVAKSRVRSRIQAMTVSTAPAVEPTPAQEPEPKEEPVLQTPTEPATADEPVAEIVSDAPTAEQAIEEQKDILADQNAIAEDNAEKEYKKDSGSTIWYVIALVLLIGCVIWLVLFAVKVMKKQSAAISQEGDTSAYAPAGDNSALVEALKSAEAENRELTERVNQLKSENKRLRNEMQKLKNDLEKGRFAPPAARTAVREQKPEESSERPAEGKMPNVIYLGRANSKGLFVRADRRFVPGNTIFRLDTRDGLVGTFFVLDREETLNMALSNPEQYLMGGCTGDDLEETSGFESIVTINAGTAIFENGCWKVLRKSKIRYE